MNESSAPARVVFSSPRWHLSGVNTMHASLTRALQARGHAVEILLTEERADRCGELAAESGLPLHSLPTPPEQSWPRRWRAITEFLTARAPCVYFPGYDFDGASVCSRLPPSVAIVGVLHSDETDYFRFLQRLGGTWNAVVGVSRFLAEEAGRLRPAPRDRVRHIPYGVDIPRVVPAGRSHTGSLRVVLAGRVWQYQKRVLDLPPLLDALARRRAAVEVTVVGTGTEEALLRRLCAPHIEQGRVRFAGNQPNARVVELLATQDVLLLLSAFEGLPLVLLEAMGRGCIPVVTDIRSGIPEVVVPRHNGFRLPIGDVNAFAATLDSLQRDAELRRTLSTAAHRTVDQGPYRVSDMGDAYARVIADVRDDARTGRAPGRTGRVTPPRHLRVLGRWRASLSRQVRRWLTPARDDEV